MISIQIKMIKKFFREFQILGFNIVFLKTQFLLVNQIYKNRKTVKRTLSGTAFAVPVGGSIYYILYLPQLDFLLLVVVGAGGSEANSHRFEIIFLFLE